MANLTRLGLIESLAGAIVVDKPAGIAFASVVKAARRKFNLAKLGHGGALDPWASGVFVLLLGDANKLAGNLMGADRCYEGTMRLGLKTNTGDIHGEPAARREVPADAGALAAKIAPEFKGDVFQTENRWCSVRREGSAGYETADTGGHKPFLAHVYRFDFDEPADGIMKFSLRASKGLIVRTFADDFGDALGCGACVETLRRVKLGKIGVEEAVPFDKLLEMEQADLPRLVLPVSRLIA